MVVLQQKVLKVQVQKGRKRRDGEAMGITGYYLDATLAVVSAPCKESSGRDRVGAGKSLADGRNGDHDGLLEHRHDGDDGE